MQSKDKYFIFMILNFIIRTTPIRTMIYLQSVVPNSLLVPRLEIFAKPII